MTKILVMNYVMAMLLGLAKDPSIDAEVYSGNLSHATELNPDLIILWEPVQDVLCDARQVNPKVLVITDCPERYQDSGVETIRNGNAGSIWDAIVPHLS